MIIFNINYHREYDSDMYTVAYLSKGFYYKVSKDS